MTRALTILTSILVLVLGQFATVSARHDGIGAPLAEVAIVSMTDAGHGPAHSGGHNAGAIDHCHLASCSAPPLADRAAASAAFLPGASRHRKPVDDPAVKAAALLQDPPVPRFPG